MFQSFGKRVRALLLLTVGTTPAMVLAQDAGDGGGAPPPCEITGQVNARTSMGLQYLWQSPDNDEGADRLAVDLYLAVMPSRTSPAIAAPASANGGRMTLNFYHRFTDASTENDEIYLTRVMTAMPFDLGGLSDNGEAFDVLLSMEGNRASDHIETYFVTTADFNGLDDWEVALRDFESDPQVTFVNAGNAFPPTTLTYDSADINAALAEGDRLAGVLQQRAQTGRCAPAYEDPPCFLTSATCEAVGLADDCWELRTLRRFRDGWLARQDGGEADIAAYYKHAPAIAARLRRDRRALLKLYWTRIVPSALAARIGANRTARAIYTGMMRELAAA